MNDAVFYMFTDVMPSEQLDSVDRGEIVSAVAVGFTHEIGEPLGLKQFKDYRRKSRRARAARDLLQSVQEGHFGNLRVVGCLSPVEICIRQGQKILDDLDGDFGPIPVRLAEGFAWYATVLAMMTIPLARYAQQLGREKASFFLDPLPGDTPGGSYTKGIELLHRLADETKLNYFWRRSVRDYGLSRISFGYAGLAGQPDDSFRDVKATAHPVLADWFAQACHADENHRKFQSAGWSKSQREDLAEPLRWLIRRGHAKLVKLDSPNAMG